MIFSFIAAAVVFGSGFVVSVVNPSLWWVSLGIGVLGSSIFSRWYSGKSRKSFIVSALTSVMFSSSAYLYSLLIDPAIFLWFAIVCVAVIARWESLWYAYSFDKGHYPLLSIPNMSVWFLTFALTIACADIWGYRLYFGYSHTSSVLACSVLGAGTLILLLYLIKIDIVSRVLTLIGSLLMYAELTFLVSLYPFVPIVRSLISSTFFLLLILLIRLQDQSSERSGSLLIRGGVVAFVSIVVVLLILPMR